MKEIFDTEPKQAEREKDFVLNPSRINTISKLQSEIMEDICTRIESGKFIEFYWGEHTVEIEFDRYYKSEYAVLSDGLSFWIANGVSCLSVYENDLYPGIIPEEYKQRLWELLTMTKEARKVRMSYRDYKNVRNDRKVKAELENQSKIEDALALLKKNGIDCK